MDLLYNVDCNKTPINNLDELLVESVNLFNELYDGNEYKMLPLNKRSIIENK